MKRSAEQQSRIKEIPQNLKKHWWRLLAIIGMLGVGSAPILFADSASQTGDVNGARTHVPEPSPAGEAAEYFATPVSTPPSRAANDEQLLIEPSPIPEPLPLVTGTPRP